MIKNSPTSVYAQLILQVNHHQTVKVKRRRYFAVLTYI